MVSLARRLTIPALRALTLDLAVPERRAFAANSILDRGWGKPAQAILAQVNNQLTVTGIDKPPEITETYEEWLIRRRTELDELERAAIGIESSGLQERAMVIESAGNTARAAKTASAVSPERAVKTESTIDAERKSNGEHKEPKFR